LNNLIDEFQKEVLTEKEIEDIKEALEEVKRGEIVPFEQVFIIISKNKIIVLRIRYRKNIYN